MTSLQQIITRRGELIADRAEREASHKAFLLQAKAELDRLAEAEALLVGGLDLAKIERGRAILAIKGKVTLVRHGYDFPRYADANRSQVRMNALADAKADLAAGGDKIARQYFGVKNYDGFGDQRTDCEYGMGPRHGSIVFSIGLCRSVRDQIKSGQSLLAEQVDAALYLLSALPKMDELQAEAAKVAA